MNHLTKIHRNLGLRGAALLSLLVCLVTFGVNVGAQKPARSLRGKIYFSNNTPANLSDFPVELFTSDQKTRIATTTLTEQGYFYLDNLKWGKYLLKIVNPDHCTLTYKVDLRQQSVTNVRIVMDAACAHHDGKIVELPRP